MLTVVAAAMTIVMVMGDFDSGPVDGEPRRRGAATLFTRGYGVAAGGRDRARRRAWLAGDQRRAGQPDCILPFIATLATLTIFWRRLPDQRGGKTTFGRDIPAAFRLRPRRLPLGEPGGAR